MPLTKAMSDEQNEEEQNNACTDATKALSTAKKAKLGEALKSARKKGVEEAKRRAVQSMVDNTKPAAAVPAAGAVGAGH